MNLRTLAAGTTGAAIAALVLETLVLFWRDDENAPIQVPQAEHSETARPSPAAVDLDEGLRVCVAEPFLIREFIRSLRENEFPTPFQLREAQPMTLKVSL